MQGWSPCLAFVANLNFWKINLRDMSPRGQPELTPVNWLTHWTILQTTWPLLQVTPGSLRFASCGLCFFNKIHLYFLASGKSILFLNCLLDVQYNNFECRPAKFFLWVSGFNQHVFLQFYHKIIIILSIKNRYISVKHHYGYPGIFYPYM